VRILGIESSCDETAAAVVEDGVRVVSSIVASQLSTHGKYGGVVPELASREHLRAIVPVVREALEQAGARLQDLDAIAATVGPGLVVSGSHTQLFEVREGFEYRLLVKTPDDAAGEAFDKVAKLLGFGYPRGP